MMLSFTHIIVLGVLLVLSVLGVFLGILNRSEVDKTEAEKAVGEG